MCFFLITVFFGPRLAIVLWWLLEPGRWDSAFDSIVLPVLGFLFFPWVTLTFVAVAPRGSVSDTDWLWLGLALIVDLMSFGFGARRRYYPA